MNIKIFNAGYCTCPEHLAIQNGRWKNIRFPAMFALLEHPQLGRLLFDTGYSHRFFEETKSFPNRVYRWLTPVTLREEDLAIHQLASMGIKPNDVDYVLISHFHADHIAALNDFKKARYIFLPQAYEKVRSSHGLNAFSKAFLPGLIPNDFDERSVPIKIQQSILLDGEYAPFKTGYDLLGDQSIIAVELPGHAFGQMGIFARQSNDLFFFVADASWLKRGIIQNSPPHKIANLLFSDPTEYKNTLGKLHDYQNSHPSVHVIPSHCEETLAHFIPSLPN